MPSAPPRLVPSRSLPLHGGSLNGWTPRATPLGQFVRLLRGVRRSILIIAWTLLAMAPQALLIRLPGNAKKTFAQLYWKIFCTLFGLEIRVLGTRASDPARRIVFVSNHTSWVDVAALGSALPACFVSKDDVTTWPLVNIVAHLGRTVFVSRQRQSTGRERDAMRERLADGDNLILFAEGTTSDGSRVLPFRSSLLAVAESEPSPLIQPVSLVYDRLSGLKADRTTRPLFSYYGATSFGAHYWRIVQWRGQRATILLHPPVDPRDFPDRKALSRATCAIVAAGAADLRQNRVPPSKRG